MAGAGRPRIKIRHRRGMRGEYVMKAFQDVVDTPLSEMCCAPWTNRGEIFSLDRGRRFQLGYIDFVGGERIFMDNLTREEDTIGKIERHRRKRVEEVTFTDY